MFDHQVMADKAEKSGWGGNGYTKIEYLENEKSFPGEIESIFIIFKSF